MSDPVEPFLRLRLPPLRHEGLPGVTLVNLDEDGAAQLLEEIEQWGDHCSEDWKKLREELREAKPQRNNHGRY